MMVLPMKGGKMLSAQLERRQTFHLSHHQRLQLENVHRAIASLAEKVLLLPLHLLHGSVKTKLIVASFRDGFARRLDVAAGSDDGIISMPRGCTILTLLRRVVILHRNWESIPSWLTPVLSERRGLLLIRSNSNCGSNPIVSHL